MSSIQEKCKLDHKEFCFVCGLWFFSEQRRSITAKKFIDAYKERFNRDVNDRNVQWSPNVSCNNYYFLSLGKKMYIDSAVYGNEARFINHSCDPNAEAKKWTVVSNGYGELRVGLFAMRKILPVSIPVILFCFYCSYLI